MRAPIPRTSRSVKNWSGFVFGFVKIRLPKTKKEDIERIVNLTNLFKLNGGSVATNAPIRNSQAREVGEKNDAAGKICAVIVEAANRIGIDI